jgi:hypothetical protein
MNNTLNKTRLTFITLENKEYFFTDLSGITPDSQFAEWIKESEELVQDRPLKSVLSLIDITDARFNTQAVHVLKGVALRNNPHIIKTAVVGAEGILKIALNAIGAFAGRDFKTFTNRETALKWLLKD